MHEALPRTHLENPHERPLVELLLIGVTSPFVAAVYEDGKCIETFRKEGKSSEVLPPFLHDVMARYRIGALYYANGPGSFMAIKVTYVMAKTLSIALGVPLFGTDAFAFNGNRPIRAIGRSCFVKQKGEIVIRNDCEEQSAPFEPPSVLERSLFSPQSEPLYVLPAL
ncbi:hypothetical protein [Hydrogenimonas sp.]